MSLREFLDAHPPLSKTTVISNHTTRRIELEYKRTNDKYCYMLWYEENIAIDVPKIIYNQYDILEKIIDNRF
jgi:hypothetical protein